jgi:hypothetical protein
VTSQVSSGPLDKPEGTGNKRRLMPQEWERVAPAPQTTGSADRCATGSSASDLGRGEAASKGRPPDPGLPDRVSSIGMCDQYGRLRHVRSQASSVLGEAVPPIQLTYTSGTQMRLELS